MDLNQFLHVRQPRWQRLTQLLDQVDRRGMSSLSLEESHELFSLYRLVSSDLNLVQTRTGNPALLDYLETLVARAYAILVVPRRARFFQAWWRIVRHYFPAALRRHWRPAALAAAAMLAGVLFGWAATLVDAQNAELFLPPEHLSQTPAQRVAALEAAERDGHSRVSSGGDHMVFSTFLFTHNIRVSVLCFALGLTFGVGTTIVLFYNGAMLGSLATLYYQDGVMLFFLGWVGPHGAIELPCIVFAATAGYMLARAQYRPEAGSVLAQLRMIRPALVDVLVGAATLLVVAGLVEGGFSQINEPTIPYALKIAVAGGLGLALAAYLVWMPAKDRPGEEGD